MGDIAKNASNDASAADISRLTVPISNFVCSEFAPMEFSVELTMSLNISAMVAVCWFHLQAYPVIYFPVAIILSTDRFSLPLFDKMIEISPFARQARVCYPMLNKM